MGHRPAIVIAATPTPNGDLHVGHIAGPYLAGDVYARALRAQGRDVIYTTCTDDSQTYVLSTARRRGTTPEALCRPSTQAIEESLQSMGISMVGLPPIDDTYRRTVLDFVQALHDQGRLRTRTKRLPYAGNAGTFLYDSLITGLCPRCKAGSAGGVCEECGHPNNYDELLEARSTLDPDDPLTYREHTILVLPVEEYRERLTAYFVEHDWKWRPHPRSLIRELLAGPLPDIPITFPGSWGIAAPFAPAPGQIIYPWVEAMPASIYSTWWSSAERPAQRDEAWLATGGAELVYFHGFDNVYHWGLFDLALLMAHGDRYIVPHGNVCNEFYDLDGAKFSTSRNHVVSSTDLLAEVPRDTVRFYLCLTAPELERTNFTTTQLREVTTQCLVEPWNRLADMVSLQVLPVDPGRDLPTSAAGRARAASLLAQLLACYALAGFSPARAARTIVGQLYQLLTAAAATPDPRTGLGDLLLQVRALLAGSAPVLIDVADRARTLGIDLASAPDLNSITPFELPRLATDHDADENRAARADIVP
jgi:methionyl-tRNA synthetase